MDNPHQDPSNKPSTPQKSSPDKDVLEFQEHLASVIQSALIRQASQPKPLESVIKIDDEKKTLEIDRLKIENRRLTTKVEEAKDLHKIRKRYTNRLFWLIVVWLIAVIAFVVLSGSRIGGFNLSDAVIIAFITSTTVSVLGLFLIPARWLFPSKEEQDHKGEG